MNIREEFRKPEWVSDWKIFLLFSLISFAIAFGLRAMELPKWGNPAFMVNGEYIMGTHDAYYWLAGAKGVGSAVDNPMAVMVRFLGTVTGAQYGNIAFWLPAVFAGFTAIAAFAWGMLVGGPWAGLICGVYATTIPPYYFRTRLGYYDTDLVTLLFPLLVSVLLAKWLSSGVRTSWLKREKQNIFEPKFWDLCIPLFAGMVAANADLWHGDMKAFSLVIAAISIGLILFCSEGQNRVSLLHGLVLFCFSAFAGMAGLVAALVLLIAFVFLGKINNKYYNHPALYFLLILCIVAFSGVGDEFYYILEIKLSSYLKPVVETAVGVDKIKYPGIAQSVIEAQNVDLDGLISNIIGSKFLGYLGFGGFVLGMCFSPLLSLLLPFVAATFAATVMGGRFAMFAGIGIGVGFSFLAVWVCSKRIKTQRIKSITEFLLFFGLSLGLANSVYTLYSQAPVTPIMSQKHSAALIEAGKHVDKNSTFWTWWDWGYATMYFTGVQSFANGGHHGGPVLFPLGFVYSSPSSLQSSQLIKFSATNKNSPALAWKNAEANEIENWLNSLRTVKYQFEKHSDQYLVVNWESVKLSYWIMYYGSWSLANGSGVHPYLNTIRNAFDLDLANGRLLEAGQRPVALSSSMFVDSSGSQVNSYNNIGPHLLYNKDIHAGILTDDYVYNSTLLKLLLGDPNNPEVADCYELVYEEFPAVRIYKVK